MDKLINNVALCRRIRIHEAEGDWSVSVVVRHVLRSCPMLVNLRGGGRAKGDWTG